MKIDYCIVLYCIVMCRKSRSVIHPSQCSSSKVLLDLTSTKDELVIYDDCAPVAIVTRPITGLARPSVCLFASLSVCPVCVLGHLSLLTSAGWEMSSCSRGEGLVWLIGAVVCLLAANRGTNSSLTRAMDGRSSALRYH